MSVHGKGVGIHVEKKFVWKDYPKNRDLLFTYAVQSITDLGYNLVKMDKESGLISFETGMSYWSWGGQNMSIVFIDMEEITQVRVSGIMKQTGFFTQLYDWGESKKIGKKILEAIDEKILKEQLRHHGAREAKEG